MPTHTNSDEAAVETALAARVRATLQRAFQPTLLEIVDETHLHAGHAGARAGGGHLRVTLVAESFAGKSRVGRHRMVHETLADELTAATPAIHALALTLYTPDEWRTSMTETLG